MENLSNYENRLEVFFNKRSQKIKLGLERVSQAHEIVSLNNDNPPCILIAGTNGKGTNSVNPPVSACRSRTANRCAAQCAGLSI